MKFKCYDTKKKEWIDKFYITECGDVYDYWERQDKHIKTAKIVRYTKMKDSLGQELFEYDIVLHDGKIYILEMSNNSYGDRMGWDLYKADGSSHEYYYGGFNTESSTRLGSLLDLTGGFSENKEKRKLAIDKALEFAVTAIITEFEKQLLEYLRIYDDKIVEIAIFRGGRAIEILTKSKKVKEIDTYTILERCFM